MTAIQDPYPEALADFAAAEGIAGIAPEPITAEVKALNRIAVALEQLVLATLDGRNATQPTQSRGLAPLPPMQTAPVTVVPGAPPCPFHGVDKVAPSRKGGFYCQAKPGIGQPNTNPKGYCVWHT